MQCPECGFPVADATNRSQVCPRCGANPYELTSSSGEPGEHHRLQYFQAGLARLAVAESTQPEIWDDEDPYVPDWSLNDPDWDALAAEFEDFKAAEAESSLYEQPGNDLVN